MDKGIYDILSSKFEEPQEDENAMLFTDLNNFVKHIIA